MRTSVFPESQPEQRNVTHTYYSGEYCPLACETTINYVSFNDTDPSLSWKVNACRSTFRINSLYLCFDEFCKRDGAISAWIRTQNHSCTADANVTLPSLPQVLNQWRPDDRDKLERLTVAKALSFPSVNHPVLPETSLLDRAFTTVEAANWEYKIHLVYGWYMYYFWVLVVAVGVANRLYWSIYKLRYKERKHRNAMLFEHDLDKRKPGVFDLVQSGLRRHLTTPALFGDRCSQPYGWCTIPPRIQSLTILLFIIFNVVFCSCSYRLTEGNLYWPNKSAQLLRFVSDRTGIISMANFPLVWLFGMRNDVLIWMTGWGFGTYNAFHRWVARVATVQAVLHSLGYTIMILANEGWSGFQQYWTRHYFWNGELATIAMCTLLALSVYTIRRKHYDFFLVTHIALSIALLWTMYYHVELFTAGEWNIFIWPCVVIWVVDRVARLARIVAFNRRPFSINARATYDPNSHLIRLDIEGDKSLIAAQPGSYYYIHMLDDVRYAHQSHPFTLAFVSSNTTSPSNTSLAAASPRSGLMNDRFSSSTESDTLLSTDVPKPLTNLVFLVRPYNGFTSRLRSSCLLHPRKIRVLVEGPYGHSIPLETFFSVVFVVGGTGIAVPLSYLRHLVSRSSPAPRVKIVWAVREHAFLELVLRSVDNLLADERIEMEVHITRDDGYRDEDLVKGFENIRIMGQRPDVHEVVKKAVEEARHRRIAVVGCGPALMVDQTRKASVKMLGMGYKDVEYFEESYKW
ncbi:hypothetical protein yc1106_04718 [Curvularia clavata]|uniref:FAD-binding FR-type domain-containing protein n=1 Tax=Curvularia clavata TaxID=95742 RepID=A0A9Q8Z7J0_CURCL|nr:hypothetical protein yc1106_04718 [Curvularia clavata]